MWLPVQAYSKKLRRIRFFGCGLEPILMIRTLIILLVFAAVMA